MIIPVFNNSDQGHDDTEPLAVTRAQAAKMLNLSERMVFELTKKGELPSKRIGRSVRIPYKALLDFIDGE